MYSCNYVYYTHACKLNMPRSQRVTYIPDGKDTSSGPTGPVMHKLGFKGSAKSHLGKQTWLSIATYILDVSGGA